MGADLMSIFFAAFRGMSQTQLLLVVGALFTRYRLWGEVGAKEVKNIVSKILLPVFVFTEYAKPASRDKLKTVFTSSEGPLLIGASTALMLTFLLLGYILQKSFASSKGMQKCGNLVQISIAFGNATALPVLLIKTIEHFFDPSDRDFLTLCVLVYGTINRGLMWTVGSAITCGQANFSLLLNEINVASVCGLLVAFSGDLIGFDLMALWHSKNNWIDFAGTATTLASMTNPILMMVAGASLSKGPGSEDLDSTAIWVSTIGRLIICVPITYVVLVGTGITASDSANMKIVGFTLLVESCMPAAAQLVMVASTQPGGTKNMSTLLFYHSVLCPITCTFVLAFALNSFGTAATLS